MGGVIVGMDKAGEWHFAVDTYPSAMNTRCGLLTLPAIYFEAHPEPHHHDRLRGPFCEACEAAQVKELA